MNAFFSLSRAKKIFLVATLAGLLTACVAPLLVNAGSQLILAILQPMVGLDPNQQNLFEQPIIKNRMVALLGPQYEPVLQLLKTADKVQREGPLFYVVSRYTPVPQLAEKAGFVWNSETNQMAVMLVTGGSPTVLAEKILANQVSRKVAEVTPQWPTELKSILDADALKQAALQSAVNAATGSIVPEQKMPETQVTEPQSAEKQPVEQQLSEQQISEKKRQEDQARKKAEADLDAAMQSHESTASPPP
ncbi:MAG TPA: hypothetical protein PLF22_09700 [Pseudomonadales bacterium]|nr:hypothetical protein [Pseudomonadales bacterium]